MALLGDTDLAQERTYRDARQPAASVSQDNAAIAATDDIATCGQLSLPLAPGMLSQISDLAYQNTHVRLVDLRASSATQLSFGPDLPVSATDMRVCLNRDWAPEGPVTQGSMFQPRAEYAARRLEGQCLPLVQLGQTAFIHHTQIEASEFLQDALAACALNAMRNTTNAAIIRSEIARRVNRLRTSLEIRLNATNVQASGDGIDLLPALQSMLIYQFIRLFSDNEISQRVIAERDEELVRILISNLVSSVKSFSEHGRWFLWIHEESLRRTILIAEFLIGVSSFLTRGWDQAEARLGRLGFTARAALWEAKSLQQWEDVWRRGPRYEVHLESWEDDMHTARPHDLEELGMLVRATFLGLDEFEEWLVSDYRALLHQDLRGHLRHP